MKSGSLLLCLFLITSLSHSQDLKLVKKVNDYKTLYEEYFVLKSDKSVKQGQYLKFYEPFMLEGTSFIQEFGRYDHNRKSGVWFSFTISNPLNPLHSIGEYADGEKIGPWYYFYTPVVKDTSIFYYLGDKKLTQVTGPVRKDKEYTVTIDTTGIRLAASGNFKNDKKVGKWSYYSTDGRLIKEYDFTENKVIYSYKDDSIAIHMLGGVIQFQSLLWQSFIEGGQNTGTFKPSTISFEIITNEGSLYINRLSTVLNDPFANYIEDRIRNMSSDWINYDPAFEKISFIIKLGYSIEDDKGNLKVDSFKPKPEKD